MADKADQALKLAQKVEKDLKALQEHLKKVEKNAIDSINEQVKKLTDLHNQQSKEMYQIKDWVIKTFETKAF